MNAFGYVRNTVDMDIWIASAADDQQSVLQAIRDFAFPDAPDNLLHEDDAMVRMGLPPLRIEVLKKISGVEFEDCWLRRVVIEYDDLQIPVISLEDLKRNKLASGRKKDLLDLDELSRHDELPSHGVATPGSGSFSGLSGPVFAKSTWSSNAFGLSDLAAALPQMKLTLPEPLLEAKSGPTYPFSSRIRMTDQFRFSAHSTCSKHRLHTRTKYRASLAAESSAAPAGFP